MASAAVEHVKGWSMAALEARVVRYADLKPCYNAFIDTRSPGSEAKENFTIIGPGVSENPNQHIHIAEPHGFNIGGARQPPGCVNSQHSHGTAEVFVIHSGRWSFNIGERGDDVRVECEPGDVISLPVGMFRGFTNIGDEVGYLFAVLGGDDPGSVLWAPYVFDMAQDYGLVLLDTGELIDTAAGQNMPDGAAPMPRTTAEQVSSLRLPNAQEAEGFVWRNASTDGTYARAIIGEAGPLNWHHGFDLDRLDIKAGGTMEPTPSQKPEVIFVHQGQLAMHCPAGEIRLNPGDTMTIPIGLDRHFGSSTGCVAYLVGR